MYFASQTFKPTVATGLDHTRHVIGRENNLQK